MPNGISQRYLDPVGKTGEDLQKQLSVLQAFASNKDIGIKEKYVGVLDRVAENILAEFTQENTGITANLVSLGALQTDYQRVVDVQGALAVQ